MKTAVINLYHLQGNQGYIIYWEKFYKCCPRFQSIEAIDLNLEIIAEENHTLLAFQHDLPEDMQSMVRNSGHWQLYNGKNRVLRL